MSAPTLQQCQEGAQALQQAINLSPGEKGPGSPFSGPRKDADVWEVLDHLGRPYASFLDGEEAFMVSRYAMRCPGFAQKVCV